MGFSTELSEMYTKLSVSATGVEKMEGSRVTLKELLTQGKLILSFNISTETSPEQQKLWDGLQRKGDIDGKQGEG